jgi:hypothetical protein
LALSQRVLEAIEDGDVEGASAAMREHFKFMVIRFSPPEPFSEGEPPNVGYADTNIIS